MSVLLAVALMTSFCTAVDWTQFRGPGGRAQSSATGLPTTWDAQTNIVWKTELPGPGASSPTTYGDRIYITCSTGNDDADSGDDAGQMKRHLICLNRADGQEIWRATQPSTNPQQAYSGFRALHGYASGTPTIDDDAIYVYYGTTGAAAYSHDGDPLWLTNCGTGTHGFGTGSSPTLYKNLVIVNACVESGSLIALDKKTGQEVWRQPGLDMSWSTPALVQTAAGDWEVVISMKGQILAFAPATGEKLWSCDGIPDYICPTPIVQGDVLFATGGRKNKLIAIRSGGRGDVTDSHKVWEVSEGANVPSPVYHDGHLYWASDKGIAYCADAETGELLYEERPEPSPGKFYASPVAVDGKLYYVSRENGAYVLPAKPKYELLAHNVIETDDSIFNGSPVISSGQILLRSDKFLYCIGE
jgi:outer membrane protein assembly factor BamB